MRKEVLPEASGSVGRRRPAGLSLCGWSAGESSLCGCPFGSEGCTRLKQKELPVLPSFREVRDCGAGGRGGPSPPAAGEVPSARSAAPQLLVYGPRGSHTKSLAAARNSESRAHGNSALGDGGKTGPAGEKDILEERTDSGEEDTADRSGGDACAPVLIAAVVTTAKKGDTASVLQRRSGEGHGGTHLRRSSVQPPTRKEVLSRAPTWMDLEKFWGVKKASGGRPNGVIPLTSRT